MTDEPVFLFIATYADPAGADEDYAAIKELHHDKVIGTYDIALVTKGENGKVHVKKHEKPTQHGAWGGVAVGAVLGVLFPPGILIGAAAGGLIGGAIGHFWRGMSRKDVHELGEMLDAGQALLIVVGHDKLEAALEKAELKADKHVEKQVDMEGDELDTQLADAQKELAKS
jgi:uncharacterized membrane protein